MLLDDFVLWIYMLLLVPSTLKKKVLNNLGVTAHRIDEKNLHRRKRTSAIRTVAVPLL